MNLFEQYGIKDIANCTLYAIELDENDDEIYIPVLYMDTLKVSTVEESTSQTHAEGGIGNPKLITWDYGKDITVQLEDALFTPASQSMNWGGLLGIKNLQLYLCHLYDRNTDSGKADDCLRTGKLTITQLSDFLIIPDRWTDYMKEKCPYDCSSEKKEHDGYVGGTSIYCWEINGYITSDDNKKRIAIEKLLLFYREQKQKWYFFNGYGYKDNFDEYDIRHYGIGYQYGDEVFNWIKENLQGELNGEKWKEYEPVATATWGYFLEKELDDVPFLTQNLFIDGYRRNCDKQWKYSDIDRGRREDQSGDPRDSIEIDAIEEGTYLPYRYYANIGVEYNTNVAAPSNVAFDINTAYNEIDIVEHSDKIVATKDFCIDTDNNLKHNEYRFLNKYSQVGLTVFLDPKTMQPYQPNSFEFYRENGQRITGNLRVIKSGETYIKWVRQKAKKNYSLGTELVIDAKHFPGNYRLVGETYKKDRYGIKHNYMFEIPLCKLHPENNITLNNDGDPTVFSMQLIALRRFDGVMMKLIEYDVENSCYKKKIQQYLNPNITLYPQPYDSSNGFNIDGTINSGGDA